MKLRELKEAAHALFVRGRYAQCAETYARIIRLSPKDPNVRVRHAESCRRAGERQSAISSYRVAASLLMEQGCESRARGALRAALELDPRDPMILGDLAQLGQQALPATALEDERLYSGGTGFFERLDARAERAGPSGARPAPQGFVPPPPPPAYVLRAAEETPAPGPLPSVPTIAPVNLDALQRAAGRGAPTMAPMPRAAPVAPRSPGHSPPSDIPVVQGRLITQAPVPPSARAQGNGARPAVASVPPGLRRPAGATVAPETAAMRPAEALGAPVSPAMRPAGATMAPVPPSPRPAGATVAPVPRGGPASGSASDAQASPLTMAPIPPGDARAAAPVPYRPEMRRLGPNAVAFRVSPQARWVVIRSDSPLEVSRAEKLPVPVQPQPGAVTYSAEQRPATSAPASH